MNPLVISEMLLESARETGCEVKEAGPETGADYVIRIGKLDVLVIIDKLSKRTYAPK